MIINIFGFIIQMDFSIKRDTLIQDLRGIFCRTKEFSLVPMIRYYREYMELRGKKKPSLRESKDYIDNLIRVFQQEEALKKFFKEADEKPLTFLMKNLDKLKRAFFLRCLYKRTS